MFNAVMKEFLMSKKSGILERKFVPKGKENITFITRVILKNKCHASPELKPLNASLLFSHS